MGVVKVDGVVVTTPLRDVSIPIPVIHYAGRRSELPDQRSDSPDRRSE